MKSNRNLLVFGSVEADAKFALHYLDCILCFAFLPLLILLLHIRCCQRNTVTLLPSIRLSLEYWNRPRNCSLSSQLAKRCPRRTCSQSALVKQPSASLIGGNKIHQFCQSVSVWTWFVSSTKIYIKLIFLHIVKTLFLIN